MCCAHRIVASTLRPLMRTSAHSDTLHSHTLIPLQNYQSKSLEIFLADRGTIPSKCCVLLQQQQQLCLKKDQLLPSKQQALAVSTMRPCLWHQVWQPACMKLGSKPPRTGCSILCNLSSVTRARGSQPPQCTNVSQRAAILRLNLLGRDGKVVAVEGEAVGVNEGVQHLTLEAGKSLVVMQLFSGRSQVRTLLLFRLMFPQKPPTRRAVSRGFRYKKFEVGTSLVCNWILWHTWKHLNRHNKGM